MKTFLLRILSAAGACLGALASTAAAADGSPLAGFGTDAEFPGHGFYGNPWGNDMTSTVNALLSAPDGKLFMVGNLRTGEDSYRLALRRLLANGYPDWEFGDAGLRSYVPPCPEGRASTAGMDSHGRIWVGISGCGDFTAYRFRPDGELDTSLLGTGVLQIAIDHGGDLTEYLGVLQVTADDGLILAGRASTATQNAYAVVQVDVNGLPRPDFGEDGVAVLINPVSVSGVSDVFLRPDGRVIAVGHRWWNGGNREFQIVRLQANGQPDASYGTHGPGFSRYNLMEGGWVASTVSNRAILERDGSVLLTGSARLFQGGSWDAFVFRWRPDGQPDLTLGPHGLRLIALDFAGPNPGENSHNSDSARHIARLGDGRYLLAGYGYDASNRSGVAVVRLNRDLSLDTSFGDGGRRRYAVPIAANGLHRSTATDLLVQPGRILVAAEAYTGFGSANIMVLLGLEHDLLFADTFGD